MLAILIVLAACKQLGPASAQQADDVVVAVVAGQSITYAEIKKKVGAQVAQMQAKYALDRHTLETETLRELINERLLENEAKDRKISVKDLLEAEVTKKIPVPTDEEIQRMYDRAKSQIDLPLNVLKPRIIEILRARSQNGVRAKFLEGLRAKAGVKETLPVLDLPVIEVSEGGNANRGPENAPIKVVIFSDFECPFCSRVVPTLHELYKKYEGKIRMAFRDFPLDMHEHARRAAEGAHCAHEQGKFWEYHDRLFANQHSLKDSDLVEHAKELKLDAAVFEKCMQSNKYKDTVERDRKEGERLGVSGTPAVFINGVMLSGALPLSNFTDVVDAFLQKGGGAR
jgi:protein-disulfide isomerase